MSKHREPNLREVPDSNVRKLGIAWVRVMQTDLDVAKNERRAEAILWLLLATPAKSKDEVIMKVAAAGATAYLYLGDGHPVTDLLGSAIGDSNVLKGYPRGGPAVIPSDLTGLDSRLLGAHRWKPVLTVLAGGKAGETD